MIRDLTPLDVDQLIELGHIMSAETGFAGFRMHEPRARFILSEIVSADTVFAKGVFQGSRLVSVFIGEAADHPFMDVRFASDLFIYSHPDHRGGISMARLSKLFSSWAKDQGADYCKLEISARTVNDRSAKFFQRSGYADVGSLLMKEVA